MDSVQISDNPLDDLRKIWDTAQHVVSAMAAVLGVEVAIIDTNFKLFATSKTFLETRGTDVNKEFVKAVYRKGVAVIPNPGMHEFCTGCKYEGKCPETAEVIRVIEKDGVRYGIILLVAYTQSQKESLLDNTSVLLEFISEMTNLIYDEILLQKSFERTTLMKRQLETTIDFVDAGILTVDRHGLITQINSHAKGIFGVSQLHENNTHLRSFLPEKLVHQLISEGKKITRCEVKTIEPRNIHCMVSANPITIGGKPMGAVLRISDFEDLCSTVYEFSGYHAETVFDDILGESEAIRTAKEQAARVSENDSTTLIAGESGTGKELFARAIHSNSRRNGSPFIAINCAAIPETLLESELFGYDEGAFSGARKGGKPGKFEMAEGGTLFLDEIGDMPLHMQVKILRVIQEGAVERVGSVRSSSVDVRIIAATNQDLNRLVASGSFRADLFYRLNVVPISTPPLRERKQDIPLLCDFFLEKYNSKMGKCFDGFHLDSMEMLSAYHWPGNVRELQNAVEYAVNIETRATIMPTSLPSSIVHRTASRKQKQTLNEKVREYEFLLIKDVLAGFDQTVEGKKLAAQELGISLPSLYRKLRGFEMERAEQF